MQSLMGDRDEAWKQRLIRNHARASLQKNAQDRASSSAACKLEDEDLRTTFLERSGMVAKRSELAARKRIRAAGSA